MPERSDMNTLSNVNTRGGETNPPSVRPAPDAFPDAISTQTGVSVRYVYHEEKQWFVFRASFGRVDKASDFLVEDNTYTYIAKRYTYKIIQGKRKRILVPLIPNLLFAYTTREKAREYVHATPALSYLTFYYNHFELEGDKNPPLIISDADMAQFIIETRNHNEHLIFIDAQRNHFKHGEQVRVVKGPFKGVEGIVTRIAGQQRVAVNIKGLGVIATAYIPTAFLEKTNC